jgi:hypothetical protein
MCPRRFFERAHLCSIVVVGALGLDYLVLRLALLLCSVVEHDRLGLGLVLCIISSMGAILEGRFG